MERSNGTRGSVWSAPYPGAFHSYLPLNPKRRDTAALARSAKPKLLMLACHQVIPQIPSVKHTERHRTHRIGWLRAAVLGANDGIISTASLIVGVAAAHSTRANVLVAGMAGLVAGAMSMATGEYVSVSSQSDTENADLARERDELATSPEQEHAELAAIYVARGLTKELAEQVSTQLMAKNALQAHARDELGISEILAANPVQAAIASAATFAIGAGLPLLIAALAPRPAIIWTVSASSLLFLGLLGSVAARAGGAPMLRGATRVAFWGALAMGLTAGAGALFGGAF